MKRGKVDEVVNPLSALSRLRSAYQTYKYGTTVPTKIEKVKQARLDTSIKQAQLKAAKQGTPAAASEVKPKGIVGKTIDVGKKAALGGTAAAIGYELGKGNSGITSTPVSDTSQPVGDKSQATLPKTDIEKPQQPADSIADYISNPNAIRKDADTIKPYPPGSISQKDVEWGEPETLRQPPRMVPEGTNKAQEDATLAALQSAIYGQESGYGRAKTDKPNYAGARGPMQIMPKTWEGLKRQGLIPKDWDINNPAHNKAGGDALVKDLYYKYGGDPAKAAAVYYGGPGAIDKEGNIKSNWRDLKNPKAPTAVGYSNQVLGRMATPDLGTKLTTKSSLPTAATTAVAVPITVGSGSAVPSKTTPPTTPVSDFISKFDYDAYVQAAKTGADLSDLSKYMKPGQVSEAKLAVKYLIFKHGTITKESVASELKTISGGQFKSRADRLDQSKVDAVLGAGKFRAGSQEANLALAQHFRQQQAQDVGQGAKPSIPAVRGAENLSPYTTAADVAGLGALGAAGASMAGRIAPKVAGVAAKALPGLNVVYQGADALRRASLGDTTGSAISAAGAVPVLGIPAIAAQAVRDKHRTGSFFPSDAELKAAVEKERDTDATRSTLKEAIKNKQKKLVKKITRIKEDLKQVKSSIESKK
jgi:hypothetical protein